ncbi:hypothetical protein HXX01_04795 [Candidatus Nomurabacteria bacterium]|nr:hypothetical protein [Candidatus Nomurabacteria bacterium]
MDQKFEFIPCTCPESGVKKHGHIYDNAKKTNSPHIYDKRGGVNFIKSLPKGEVTKENVRVLLSAMSEFFKKSKKSWFFIKRYPKSCRVGEYREDMGHRYLTEEELSTSLQEWSKDLFYTGIVITELKNTGKMIDRKDLSKKYFTKKIR